ncbi:NAD(P)-dependent alcohol dehydrogenase [Croceimicrobium hydrocarbonivorans]|uniref:NAD(P)-dependent alcohol dehydrogenase n=1 Tax=Croceimicrobium hydrocarbonivorans TaxID=2761580 RepID=A0A7H0VIH2_9FLAO|nr:NAD(P)-dependent alcohol dehydrogenase [Croceimicrobium hydrocarbonivorans]QNR25520.1 NAD(P)-dependent alcohol dehydrogenase [Croceimicrobium hydrocarbonivorans]
MKAIVAQGYGSPKVFRLEEIDRPEVEAGKVLIKVEVSAATRADAQMRSGKPYVARLFTGISKPKNPIPGTGYAGVVEAVGEGVKDFKAGDRVFGETTLGFSANAEYLLTSADDVLMHLPEIISFSDAAPLGDGAVTSVNFLREVGMVKPGQKVLINGASGALGTSAVQLAKYYGAEVTGVCSTRNVGLVKSLGADHVIDYSKEDFTTRTEAYDLIYDTIGKSSFPEAKGALKKGGKYLSPVMSLPLLWQMLLSRKADKKALFAATGLLKPAELRALLSHLLEVIAEGKHKTVIDRQFPLEKLAEAHTYIDAGHKKGNIIITHS